ncbi:hypothetical protein T492DRAFT_907398 [Pavlovales sp. CCMP2436]|nr:hypothetical protein T492DRAFT_907398 [Pavlovales sp. CCMP2436]
MPREANVLCTVGLLALALVLLSSYNFSRHAEAESQLGSQMIAMAANRQTDTNAAGPKVAVSTSSSRKYEDASPPATAALATRVASPAAAVLTARVASPPVDPVALAARVARWVLLLRGDASMADLWVGGVVPPELRPGVGLYDIPFSAD